MKATDPLHPTTEEGSVHGHKILTTTQGIDLLTHMSIEFTKALLSGFYSNLEMTRHIMEKSNTAKIDATTLVTKMSIEFSKELIKQLNEEK